MALIDRIYWKSEGRYGSPRVHKALEMQGVAVSRKRVARLMQAAGLVGRVTQVTRKQPGLKRFKAAGENLLLDMTAPDGINQVWVADVTYIKVKQKWRYLATVMDVYSRRVIGWSLGDRRTTALTENALTYALKKRAYPKGVVFHTDRGIEYTNHHFQALLKRHGLSHSVNRPGHCTDNAYMESFYHSLKGELIRGVVFSGIKSLRKSLRQYINKFYNTVRLHSGIDYLSPVEFERRIA
jgi:putative transposase